MAYGYHRGRVVRMRDLNRRGREEVEGQAQDRARGLGLWDVVWVAAGNARIYVRRNGAVLSSQAGPRSASHVRVVPRPGLGRKRVKAPRLVAGIGDDRAAVLDQRRRR